MMCRVPENLFYLGQFRRRERVSIRCSDWHEVTFALHYFLLTAAAMFFPLRG